MGYEPSFALNILHNSVRVSGSNDLVTTFGVSDEAATQEYVIGAGAPGVAILVVFILSLFVLCCAGRCCCAAGCGEKKQAGSMMVIITAAVAILTFLLAFVGFSSMKTGFNGINAERIQFSGFLDPIVDILKPVKVYVNNISAAVGSANETCQQAVTAMGISNVFDIPELREANDQVNDVFDKTIPNAIGAIKNVTDSKEISDLYAEANTYIGYFELAFLPSLIFMSLIVFVFAVTSALLAFQRDQAPAFARKGSEISACLLFSLGLVLLLLLCVVNIAAGATGTVLADLCVPNSRPIANFASLAVKTPNVCTLPTLPQDGSATAGYLCYADTCQGKSPLDDAEQGVKQITDTIVQNVTAAADQLAASFETAVSQYKANNGNQEPPGTANCRAGIDGIKSAAKDSAAVSKVVENLFDYLSCENISKIVKNIVEVSLCNGMGGGAATLFIALSSAVIILIVCLVVYRSFRFHDPAAQEESAVKVASY